MFYIVSFHRPQPLLRIIQLDRELMTGSPLIVRHVSSRFIDNNVIIRMLYRNVY